MQVSLRGNVKPQSQRGRRVQVQNGISFVECKLLTTKMAYILFWCYSFLEHRNWWREEMK